MKLGKIIIGTGLACAILAGSSAWYASSMHLGIGTTNTNKPTRYVVVDNETGKPVSSSCLGGYTPIIPSTANLESSVTDAVSYSPITINDKWHVGDHVGVTDTAYSGARHVVAQDGGIQFYGYDSPPYNDIMLMDLGKVPASMNAKQAPVRTDWHTIRGSGMVFNAKFTPGTNDKNPREMSPQSNAKFEGYAFVMNFNVMEVRKYPEMSMSEFLNGSENYQVLLSIPKTCNSQSLTVTQKNGEYTFKIGLKEVGKLTLPTVGTYGGLMCDYAPHGCESLSSMYIFNFTVDGVDHIKPTSKNASNKPSWKDGLKYVGGAQGGNTTPQTTPKPSTTPAPKK